MKTENITYKSSEGEVEIIGKAVMCPGCEMTHVLYIKKYGGEHSPVWDYNGNDESPTFSPSLLVRYTWGPDHINVVCHSFIREGKFQFLGDCTHQYANQIIEIPEWKGFSWDEY